MLDESPPSFLVPDEPSEHPTGARPMVLVVDDDRSTCLVTALALESLRLGGAKVAVETATSSDEAMAVLSESTPWVVITDQRMETNDAGERLAAWIAQQPRLAQVKVIMRTGLTPEELGTAPVGVHAVWPKTALDVQGMRRAILVLVADRLSDEP